MDDTLTRIFEDLVARVSGPVHFRVILQPLMASIFAFLDARSDAHDGRSPYFARLVTDPEHRRPLLRSRWKSVRKLHVLAPVLDAVHYFRVLRWFYPFEALLVAFILAIIPYVALRGILNRLTFRKSRGGTWKPGDVVKGK